MCRGAAASRCASIPKAPRSQSTPSRSSPRSKRRRRAARRRSPRASGSRRRPGRPSRNGRSEPAPHGAGRARRPGAVAGLRAALQDALGPIYRVEREVRPIGDCRMFVAREAEDAPGLLVKVLPPELLLGLGAEAFERELLLLVDRVGAPPL